MSVDAKKIIDAVIAAAKAAAPFVSQQAEEGVALASSIVDLINHTISEYGEGVDELVAERDALEARVNAHVDKTVKDLRGE